MRKKVLILGLCLLGVTHSLSSKDKKSIPLYKDAKAPIEKRIDDLISRDIGGKDFAAKPIYIGTK